MPARLGLFALTFLLLPVAQVGAEGPIAVTKNATSATNDLFTAEVSPFINRYCLDCHSGEASESGVDLSQPVTHAEAQRNPGRWNQIRGLIELGAMPPADHDPLPTVDERTAMAARIDQLVNRIECGVDNDPGRVTIRRLNAFEYDNTIGDLFGVEFRPSELVGFPSDDVGNGFNNQGEILSLSPLLLEKYLDAAEAISQRIIAADIEHFKQQKQAKADQKKPTEPTTPRLLTVWPNDERSPRQAAQELFAKLLPRLYRRPVEAWEAERLATLADTALARGETYPNAIALGMQAALVSPNFLFRVEPIPVKQETTDHQPVSQQALASRLSYFLRASLPDETLLAAANGGKLASAGALESEALRLLKENGPDRLIEGFFVQWLGLGGLAEAAPNEELYRVWNSKLREAMRTETLKVCQEIIAKDMSLMQLLRADFTYVNPRMAEVYGMNFEGQDPRQLYLDGPGHPFDQRRRRGSRRDGLYQREDEWKRVPVPNGRLGIVTHASVLTMNSNPSNTSPVKRGKWVLETLLGDPPPPAPPSVPGLEETAAEAADLSLRQQLELHRANPSCASCHQKMDPIGFALQNFNPIGQWRDTESGQPIDVAGTLEGTDFNGPIELIDLLSQSEEKIARQFAERLMVYALGRGLRPADHCAIDQIVANAAKQKYRISAFIVGVVRSDPFRMRRPEIIATAQATATTATTQRHVNQ